MYELMIVDDERAVVEGIAATLPWRELGIETVHKAYSGQEALDRLAAAAVDVVITDIRMPGISGIDLIRQIRQTWPRTKTILLSGHSEFEYAKEAMRQHASDYLLKPVRDEDLRASVETALAQIRAEWEAVASYERAVGALRANLPLLRADLLGELLEGRKSPSDALRDKLELLELPFAVGDQTAVVLVRLEGEFAQYDARSLSLFEYAIVNMAEELFQDGFRLWTAKDRYDYLVLLVKPEGDEAPDTSRLETLAVQLQKQVAFYLKGTISLVASPWGEFPSQLVDLYESAVASLRRRIGAEREFFVSLRQVDGDAAGTAGALKSLYEPPSLLQLFEGGRWEAAEEKLDQVFAELQSRFEDSLEHLLEVFFAIASTLSHVAHKNGRRLEDLIGREFELVTRGGTLRSAAQLQEWTRHAIGRIRGDMESEAKDTRSTVVKQVHEYIEHHLAGDLSLNAIADHVHLHPVYLSRVYKLETGSMLSDYLFRYRMDKAAYLLKNTDDRIYEIAEQLGYTNPPYFIKVFKKEFGMTPQEFRDRR